MLHYLYVAFFLKASNKGRDPTLSLFWLLLFMMLSGNPHFGPSFYYLNHFILIENYFYIFFVYDKN